MYPAELVCPVADEAPVGTGTICEVETFCAPLVLAKLRVKGSVGRGILSVETGRTRYGVTMMMSSVSSRRNCSLLNSAPRIGISPIPGV